MRLYWLLIDDVRSLPCADFTARSYAESIEMLETLKGDIDTLVLDDDLGEEKDGYDVMMYAIENNLLPPKLLFVAANPDSLQRFQAAAEHGGYTRMSNPKNYVNLSIIETEK
jgi:hypothetical protein